jgi:hypothetical protein
MQMLRDALNQLACVLEAIAMHPDIFPVPPMPKVYKYADYTEDRPSADTPSADTPPADTPIADKSEMFCANCGQDLAVAGYQICEGCAHDIENNGDDEVMFFDDAVWITALEDAEDGDRIDTVDD